MDKHISRPVSDITDGTYRRLKYDIGKKSGDNPVPLGKIIKGKIHFIGLAVKYRGDIKKHCFLS